MKMEFIFDDVKLKQNDYTKDQCLNVIRKMYARHNSKTIKEIQEGVFEGYTDTDWSILVTAANLPHTKWFLKVIKEWYFYVDEDDGKGIQKEDCLASYYKIKMWNFS